MWPACGPPVLFQARQEGEDEDSRRSSLVAPLLLFSMGFSLGHTSVGIGQVTRLGCDSNCTTGRVKHMKNLASNRTTLMMSTLSRKTRTPQLCYSGSGSERHPSNNGEPFWKMDRCNEVLEKIIGGDGKLERGTEIKGHNMYRPNISSKMLQQEEPKQETRVGKKLSVWGSENGSFQIETLGEWAARLPSLLLPHVFNIELFIIV